MSARKASTASSEGAINVNGKMIEPGRIGNLTPQQELKLKEMWCHVLVANGSAPESLLDEITAKSSAASSPTEKKRGMFSMRRASTASTGSAETNIQSARTAFEQALSKIPSDKRTQALMKMYKADHPDNLMLRFLRARKWVVADALKMLGEALAWRVEFDVESLTRRGELGALLDNDDELLLQFRSKKAYQYGVDKKGRPIVHVRPNFHDPHAQSEKTMEHFTVLIIEQARLFLRDPVDTAAVIFDLSKFSLANMDYAAVKFIIKCFEASYPESLGFILIHKAPWIFQGIWNIIKNWIDPVVAAKISFTRNHDDMAKFIDDKYIPKDLGGKREYEYQYVEPEEDENDAQKDTETRDKLLEEGYQMYREFEKLVVDWIRADTDQSSNDIQARKNDLVENFQNLYWNMDPYVRGKGITDRIGVLKNPVLSN